MENDHQIATAFDVDSSLDFQTWRASLPEEKKEILEFVFRASAQSEAREITNSEVVAVAQGSDWIVSPPRVGPADLISLLQAPLCILVENEINDGAFLEAVGFGFDRDQFIKCRRKGRIRFEHAGGSTMLSLIEARANDPKRRHRMWAVFDSDALVPGSPSTEAQEKRSACEAAPIRHHMLHRRAIENYIPPDELDQATPHDHRKLALRRAVGSFSRLQPEQRAHYNLKGGFDADRARLAPGGADAAIAPKVEAHFAAVTADDRSSLAAGFGKHIAALFVPEPAQGRPGISEASRRRDGQEHEMTTLFRAIVRSL